MLPHTHEKKKTVQIKGEYVRNEEKEEEKGHDFTDGRGKKVLIEQQ